MKPKKQKRCVADEEGFFFFPRNTDGDVPAGVTVSRKKQLPKGDFRITEYSWGQIVLWFVTAHKFTADERERAYDLWVSYLTDCN